MYWDKLKENTLELHKIGEYDRFENMRPTTEEGYRCDLLQHTSHLFLGSCDMDGPISFPDKLWSRRVHTEVCPKVPYIALGGMHTGFPAMVRRLYSYCKQYGAPKFVFAVVPRPVAIEVPLSTGQLLNISDRYHFPNWILKHKAASQEDIDSAKHVTSFLRRYKDEFAYHVYQFEQCSAFLETICERYKIDFRWVPNQGATAILHYQKYLIALLVSTPWMKNRLVGVPLVVDLNHDGTIGDQTQAHVSVLHIQNSPGWPEVFLQKTLDTNLNYLRTHHSQKIKEHA